MPVPSIYSSARTKLDLPRPDSSNLKRILRKYVDYYHSCRTHLSLEKDAPEPRRVESPAMGKVRAIPKVGGLHHYYTRRAA